MYRREMTAKGGPDIQQNRVGLSCNMGEMQKALEKLNEALSFSRAAGDRESEANGSTTSAWFTGCGLLRKTWRNTTRLRRSVGRTATA